MGVTPLVAVGAPVAPLIPVPAAMPLPVAPKQPMKAPSADEPPAKKAKTEDQLVPEGEFLAKFPEVGQQSTQQTVAPQEGTSKRWCRLLQGVVTFNVQVPNISDKSDWKCNGQTVELTLPLTDTV